MNKHKHNLYSNFFSISLVFLFFGLLPLTSYTQNCTFDDPQKQREYEVMREWYRVNVNTFTSQPSWKQLGAGRLCDICELASVNCDSLGYVSKYTSTKDQILPENIGNLVHLKFLSIGVIGITSLPESIGNLSKLELLSLGGNNIATLPESIGNLKSLKRILLNGNQLASLPNSFGNLTNLKIVDLESNNLTSLPASFSQLVNLTSLNLIRNNITCFPLEIAALCETPVQVLMDVNPIGVPFKLQEAFPGTGFFIEGYCNNPEAYVCSVENTANCSALTFTNSNEQITISNLTPKSTIEIIGSNTNWQIEPICNGNCSETQTIPDLMAGEYTVKVQLIGKDGSYCYREEKVMVSGNGGENGNGNTGENANCNNLKFTGDDGQIKIEDLNAAYNKVEIIGRNTDWRIRTICDGNCTDTQLIPNLSAGEYAVKVHQVGADGVYCYREEKVNVTGSGGNGNNGNTSNTANCNNVSFSSTNGQIAVAGLTAAYDKVEIIGRNTNWQVQTICDGNCTDTQIIPNLSNGAYTVKVNQGGNDGSYCYREESINVSTSNTSRTNHKIHLVSYQKAQKVALQWTANHLAATKYFLVERSIDGATFEPLTLIKNIENNSLHWTDEQPQKGKNHYRVRQVLDNDQIVYSTVSSETFFLGGETITLFPNPAKDQLSIHTAFLKGKEGTIQIYNAYGQSVTQQNKVSFETPYQSLDISTLENGIYWLSIQVGTQPMISKRFVVEHWR